MHFDIEEFRKIPLPTESEIIKDWGGDFSSPTVSVVCITFNQEEYIQDTIRGFLLQKTKFPFEIIIHDDASQDSTAEIILDYQKKYPKLIKPVIQSENKYSRKIKVLSLAAGFSSGEYIAFCEGDDFWIDVFKLQKQVDILNFDSSIALVHSNCLVLNHRTSVVDVSTVPCCDLDFEKLLGDNRIQTLTVVIRKDIYSSYVNDMSSFCADWKMEDYPTWLYCALNHKIAMIPDCTAVYRFLPESASHSQNKYQQYLFNRSYSEIKLFFYFYGKVDQVAILRKIYNRLFIKAAIHGDDEFVMQILSNSTGITNKLKFIYYIFNILKIRKIALKLHDYSLVNYIGRLFFR